MGESTGAASADALQSNVSLLRGTQNSDGGWGYFPGKQSWLEPTFYAAVALHGEPAADRAWNLLKSWQSADGSWRPSSEVQVANWGTSLCVTMAQARGEFGEPFRKGVEWLAGSTGVHGPLWQRILLRTGLFEKDRDTSFKGWPWKPNTSSWVEPTAHALIALKNASRKIEDKNLRERIQLGEALLMGTRCADGGWNYGSPSALKIDLPSYPETTALALLGLQGRKDLGPQLDLASKMARETTSPLARAWLTIALKLHGAEVPESSVSISPSPEIVIVALQAIVEGNYKLFLTGAAA